MEGRRAGGRGGGRGVSFSNNRLTDRPPPRATLLTFKHEIWEPSAQTMPTYNNTMSSENIERAC